MTQANAKYIRQIVIDSISRGEIHSVRGGRRVLCRRNPALHSLLGPTEGKLMTLPALEDITAHYKHRIGGGADPIPGLMRI